MEDKMYIFYLKTNRVVCVIGDDFQFDSDTIIVIKDRKIKAAFMVDGVEGFVIKKNTEAEEGE
jgi:predicted protein tyrosine phosphatase